MVWVWMENNILKTKKKQDEKYGKKGSERVFGRDQLTFITVRMHTLGVSFVFDLVIISV